MLKKYECPLCHDVVEAVRDLVAKEIACPHCKGSFTLGAGKPDAGMTVAGYRMEEKLGSGGMGDVWLATQLSMDRRVALKLLPSSMNQSPEAVLAFTREARLLAKLDHPNIVTAFDFGEYAGLYYLAMTYVEGEDLAVRLEKQGTLPEPEALGVALKVAEALQYAWSQFKLLHRDINPANIMIDRYGDVRLMDLGIGKTMMEGGVDADTEQHLVGTPNYMSPEQAEGRADLDCRADMYALGASLYHVLTGRVPFDDPDPMKVLERLRTEDLPALPRSVSADCAALITRLMQRDREDRFASWDEVVSALKQFKIQTRVQVANAVPPLGAATVPAPRGGKKPALIVLGFLLFGVLLGLAAISIWQHDRDPVAVLPPPSGPDPVPVDPVAGTDAETAEAQRQAKIQQLQNQIKSTRAYLKGAEPDFDQALLVLEKLLPSAEAAGAPHLVLREMDQIREKKEAAREEEPEVVSDDRNRPLNGQEQARLTALVNACGRDLFNRDFSGALNRVKQAGAYDWPNPGLKQLKQFRNGIRQLSSVQEQVHLSFAGEVGREVLVPFNSGKEKLRIVDAGQDPVVAEIVLRKDGEEIGAVRRALPVDGLEKDEQIRRAGHAAGDLAPLARSLMALKHQDFTRAREEVAEYEGLFAKPFKAELAKQSE